MSDNTNKFIDISEKLLLLSRMKYEYFNLDAVFSDETEDFRTPLFPKKDEDCFIKIRLWKNNADEVFLVCGDDEIKMKKTLSRSNFDFYRASIKADKIKTSYYFKIISFGKTYFYSKQGVTSSIDENYSFVIIRDFEIPKWVQGAVMYQIYVDRFYNGDKSNDVVNNEYAYLGRAAKNIDKWDKPVENDDICNFYGGDLKGVMDKMGYLKELGVDVIYFNPIFVSPSNHKYDIQDYDYIDPHYGVIVKDGGEPLYFEKFRNRYATMYMQRTTSKENLQASNDLMIKLIKLAHKNGIKIILDGVFNHCGAFNKWLDKEGFYSANGYPDGAYKAKDSIYHDYFKWYDENWPNNDCYDSWWGHDNHPKLNYEGCPQLYSYIINIGKKWVSPPFNADGWRLDVAADLGYSKEFNHKFWRDFRKAVKEANPEAVILAEHYGDASDWLNGDQWDTIMNYDAFMEPVTWFLTGMEKHSESYNEGLYCNAMRYHGAKFSYQSLTTAMNELSNHDHSRFLTRTNRKVGRLHTVGREEADTGINKAVFMEAVAIQMTWPGAPTVYYGDEAGLTGWTDPDNRRPYPWGNEDKMLINYHKEMIRLHKKYSAIKKGSLEYLHSEYGILCYSRFNKSQKIVVAINNNSCEKEIYVPVWRIECNDNDIFFNEISSDQEGFTLNNGKIKVCSGGFNLKLKPFSSCVWVKEK